MSLQDLFNTQMHLEADLRISPQWQSGNFRIEHYQDGAWVALENLLSESDVDAMLRRDHYQPINKRSWENPFSACWDYRRRLPEWMLFQSWLVAYLMYQAMMQDQQREKYLLDRNMHEYGVNAAARYSVYQTVLEQAQKAPDLQWLLEWAWDQYEGTEVYSDFPDDDEDDEAWFAWTRTREYLDQRDYRTMCHYTWKHVADTLGEYRDVIMRNTGGG